MVKHSIIKALNRLHARKIPVDENTEQSKSTVEGSDEKEPVTDVGSSNPEQADALNNGEDINTEEKLDFSNSPLDKQ